MTYTAKTVEVKCGIVGYPRTKQVHKVLRADGSDLRTASSIKFAQKIADELNDFEKNPPKFGDLEAEFERIGSQDEE